MSWLRNWWVKHVCTDDQKLINSWETDPSELPIIEQHYKDGTKRVLTPAEVYDLYDPQMGAYVLPDEHHEMVEKTKSEITREYAEKQGIPVVDLPLAPVDEFGMSGYLTKADREHELTMIQADMDNRRVGT
ncbi:hypothetical protein EVB68_011 [Rhizobium phage RHph_Y2_6]|uniref:Uncharacterized protein n=1 Tax=Rhizobium phage RHph_Y2_6 TaxID=2509576 RepID=A0A7S5UT06_9CAUD|nr:hypothetical protein PP748_gp011 [Rhizobium phage RHph_Y2_6]QIG68748.1 hypothetical protein EVB68_011 [Rhizobium phage RHph_Y2_6]